jgi:serine/threonine-protein kinase
MLLQRPSEPRVLAGAFEECSSCGSLFDEGARRCSLDGTALNPVRLPRQLAGRYQLNRRQGGGGMGTVYEATDTELERRVAVKVMREDLASHPGAAERFRREARIAAAFSHPNVVTVHDFGLAGDSRAYLVMEFLEGVDLRGELKQKRRLAPRAVVEVLRGVCAALEAAHRRELTHRDIKPENIFLARSGRIEIPKVLDFGVAKLISSSTQTQSITETGPGQLVGTLRYMSPEQLRGEPATSAADLWALAVVAYEMLAGEYPFDGANTAEWHAAVIAGRFAPLSRHLEHPRDSWTAFFGRALAPDPGKRPAEASTFHRELENALSAHSV